MIGPPRPPATSEVPVLLRAVHTTIRTIETRARIYRWAAVAVALSLVVPIVSALVCSSWRPLTLAALLLPTVGAFLIIDGRAVLDWQRSILDLWLSGDLRLSDLRQALRGMSHLPTGTVAAMLDRLPAAEPSGDLDRLSSADKASALAHCLERGRREDRRTSLAAAGATLLVCSASAALTLRAAAPLFAIPLGLVLLIAAGHRRR